MRGTVGARRIRAASILIIFLCVSSRIDAEEALLPVDGIAAFVGGSADGEFDASPVLLSDVELEASLILMERDGALAAVRRPSPSEWRFAEERAILVRLLAEQARRLNETASDESRTALLGDIVARLGGVAAMNRLLARLGVPRSALDRWVENAVLAVSQVRFIQERVSATSERPTGGSEMSGETTDTYRRMVGREVDDETLRRGLHEAIRDVYIRVVR